MSENNSSFTAMAKALREGESISRSIRIPIDEVTEKNVKKRTKNLRNNLNQLAIRARETTERGYRVESGQFMTHDGTALIITVVITCMEDEGEDDI